MVWSLGTSCAGM